MAPVSPFSPASRAYGTVGHTSHWDRSTDVRSLDADGRLNLRLEWFDGRLHMVNGDNMLVSADARGLAGRGVYGFDVRGLKYYKAAARRADTRPGRQVELVREPQNEYGTTAIAVRGSGSKATFGYVNKGLARSLCKVIDTGAPVLTVVLQGTGPGRLPDSVTVLAAAPEMFAHLCRIPWPPEVVELTDTAQATAHYLGGSDVMSGIASVR